MGLDHSPHERARKITELKPHIKLNDALDAVASIDEFAREARDEQNRRREYGLE